jgi:twitching motility protein PilU
VEVLINTKLTAEMIEKGDFPAVKEAMVQSMAEGSQSFDEDLARLIQAGSVTRDEALVHSDSPTNLLWRLQNTAAARPVEEPQPPSTNSEPETATFTEITLDVRPDDLAAVGGKAPWQRR